MQCVYPVFDVIIKQTRGRLNHVKRTKKRQKFTLDISNLQLLSTGASRQLDVLDFLSSAASGWQQRHSVLHFWCHYRSIGPQLSLRPQRVQGGHSPTPQSPASHAEHNCVKLAFQLLCNFFAVSSLIQLLL